MPQYIRFDLFPAHVEVVDDEEVHQNTYDNCRIIVTDDSVLIYVDSSTGPSEAFNSRLDDFSGDVKVGWTALTSDGDTLSFRRSHGCGCGSRLRGFRPFPGVPHEYKR